MICVIFTSKLEIPEDGNDVLDDVLDAKQFWYKVYALSAGDFNLLIRLVIQIIYISWKTICADYSQGNEALFGENAGKQCVAMSLTAIIYHHIEDINLWTSSILNNILTIENNLYTSIRCSVQTND